MSVSTLSQCVNIRKAVARNARYAGRLGVKQLPQYEHQLHAPGQPLGVTVEFGQDDHGQQFLAVELSAEVVLECQRCLQPVCLSLYSRSLLGLVPDDEGAQQLPAEYEPLVAIDEVDLWQVAGEELALALPVVAYHPDGECRMPNGDAAPYEEDKTGKSVAASPAGGAQENPFGVLSTLLGSAESKEK